MASVYLLSSSSDPQVVRYVGITKHDDPSRRFAAHVYRANAGSMIPVHCWIRSKFSDNIDIIVTTVSRGITWKEACEIEISLIALHRENGNSKLLNVTNGGEGSLGVRQSEETRARRSASMIGKSISEETKKKISSANLGKRRTSEAKKKMSNAKIGKKLSDQHKKNLSNSLKGRKCSIETKEKISKAQKGKKLSDAHMENLLKAQRTRRQREKIEKELQNEENDPSS